MSAVQSGLARHWFITGSHFVKRQRPHGFNELPPLHEPMQTVPEQSPSTYASEIPSSWAVKHA